MITMSTYETGPKYKGFSLSRAYEGYEDAYTYSAVIPNDYARAYDYSDRLGMFLFEVPIVKPSETEDGVKAQINALYDKMGTRNAIIENAIKSIGF